MKMRNLLYTIVGLVAGVSLTLTSIGSPARTADAQVDALAAAQKAQVIATTFQLDKSGFHDIDETLAAGSMPSGALGSVRRARIAAQATDWPEPLRENATKLINHMLELESTLKAENVGKSAPLAKEVHEVAHDLSSDAYSWLAGEQPAPASH